MYYFLYCSAVCNFDACLLQGEQTTLPKGPLSLDGVFERRDKPKLKHLALFLFPDRLLCASVGDLPYYRIKV